MWHIMFSSDDVEKENKKRKDTVCVWQKQNKIGGEGRSEQREMFLSIISHQPAVSSWPSLSCRVTPCSPNTTNRDKWPPETWAGSGFLTCERCGYGEEVVIKYLTCRVSFPPACCPCNSKSRLVKELKLGAVIGDNVSAWVGCSVNAESCIALTYAVANIPVIRGQLWLVRNRHSD